MKKKHNWKLWMVIMLISMILLACTLLTGCSKEQPIPNDEEKASYKAHNEPVMGIIPISADAFPVCTGELVEYKGNISYTYTVNNNIINLHVVDDSISGKANGKGYSIYIAKDTSFHVNAGKKYTFSISTLWIYPSHITFNLSGNISIYVNIDSRMRTTITAGRIQMTCQHPPYLY